MDMDDQPVWRESSLGLLLFNNNSPVYSTVQHSIVYRRTVAQYSVSVRITFIPHLVYKNPEVQAGD